jgi:hypothetical protein
MYNINDQVAVVKKWWDNLTNHKPGEIAAIEIARSFVKQGIF